MDKRALYARDFAGLEWSVSSKSHDDDPPDNCVQCASFPDGVVALRDSHDTSRPALVFTPGEWSAFTAGLRAGEFGS
jgi:hypothetical protein